MGFALVPDVGGAALSVPAAIVLVLLRWWIKLTSARGPVVNKTPAEYLREARDRAACDPGTGRRRIHTPPLPAASQKC
ncbi:hypothetical protein PCL_04449 [Purpureocillium lilacinum]|uniref:Uncharacterized protein n=1 Tax=Purpureocillium lilacinum TaxID=33203 RepID=A0A2U3DXG5_PURLI|nr:hypothetical protein PCL_04449 [Purpureocillium lilacinum]